MGPETPSALADPREVDRAPFLAGRMRRETALLLGAKCADDGLADLDLPGAFSRTSEWRAALQRGDFIPTFEMVNQLDGVLVAAERPSAYTELAVELESFPLGAKARELRETYGVAAEIEPIVAKPVGIGSGLSPYTESIRARDRLLVTGPIVRASTLLTFQVFAVLWSQSRLTDLAWPAVVGLPAFLGFALVPSLPTAEKAFAFFCEQWRSSDATERLKKIEDDREGAGLLPTHPGCWHQEGEGVHLLSSVRETAQRKALAADSLERMTLVFGLNAAVMSGLLLALALASEFRAALLFGAALAVLASLTFASRRLAHRSQSELEALIRQGLGIPPKTPTRTPPEPPEAPQAT